MLCRIETEKFICYNEPFSEMEGDIIFVDYELSSWKHLDKIFTYHPNTQNLSGGPPSQGSQLIIKSAYVVNKNNGDYNIIIQTGMGIADGERGNLLSQKMNGFWKIHEQ